MTDVVVGVDLGSGGVRAIALDRSGEVRGKSFVNYKRPDSWPEGRADPQSWLEGFERAIGELFRESPEAVRPVALSVGGQSPTTIPVRGGMAVTCGHTVAVDPGLRDAHEAQVELLRGESGEEVEAAEIGDWVLRQLGANDFLSIWPGEPFLEGFGDPVETGVTLGEASGRHGVPAGTRLVSGAADAYLSFWACGIDVAGRGHDPGGYTGGLGVAVDTSHCPPEMYSIPSAVKGVGIVGGPVNGHGRVLDWWARLSGQSVDAVLESAARIPAGSQGVVVLPYHSGERCPRWESRLTGEIHGLTVATELGEISRAVLEGAAYGLAHIAHDLRAEGVPLDLLVCGGTPGLSRLWCEIKASVLEVPVLMPRDPQYLASRGAALAAGSAVDWWPRPLEGGPGSWLPQPSETVEPSESSAYRDGFERYKAFGDAAIERLSEGREV